MERYIMKINRIETEQTIHFLDRIITELEEDVFDKELLLINCGGKKEVLNRISRDLYEKEETFLEESNLFYMIEDEKNVLPYERKSLLSSVGKVCHVDETRTFLETNKSVETSFINYMMYSFLSSVGKVCHFDGTRTFFETNKSEKASPKEINLSYMIGNEKNVFPCERKSFLSSVGKVCHVDGTRTFFETNKSGKTSLKLYEELRRICCKKENALSCITENQKSMHISLNKHFETDCMKKLSEISDHIKTAIDNVVKGFESLERKDEPFPNIENVLYNKKTSISRFGNRIRCIFHDGLHQKKDFENLKEVENMLRIESVWKYESLKIREKFHLWINCSEPERMLETVEKRVPNWILLHQPFYITS